MSILYFVDDSFVIANARVVDYPIVFANDGFSKITGYSKAEVIQHSGLLKFMWSDDTDRGSVTKMEEAFSKQEILQIELYAVKKTSK